MLLYLDSYLLPELYMMFCTFSVCGLQVSLPLISLSVFSSIYPQSFGGQTLLLPMCSNQFLSVSSGKSSFVAQMLSATVKMIHLH